MKLRILEILKEKGKTKYWLYIQLGLSYQNFNNIVNNKTKSIKFENLKAICDILECTPNDLFEEYYNKWSQGSGNKNYHTIIWISKISWGEKDKFYPYCKQKFTAEAIFASAACFIKASLFAKYWFCKHYRMPFWSMWSYSTTGVITSFPLTMLIV